MKNIGVITHDSLLSNWSRRMIQCILVDKYPALVQFVQSLKTVMRQGSKFCSKLATVQL